MENPYRRIAAAIVCTTCSRTRSAGRAIGTPTISPGSPASRLPSRRPAWLPPVNALMTTASKRGAPWLICSLSSTAHSR